RNTVDAPRFDHLGLGRARNLVIDDFFRLFALIAPAAALGLRSAARQFGADRYGALFVVVGRRLLFASLAGSYDAAVGIEFIRGLSDAIDVEIRIDLDARMARPDHRRNNGFYLAAQAGLVRKLAFIGVGAGKRIVGGGAIGKQFAGFVDNGNALGLETIHRAGNKMADSPYLLWFQRASHLQYDGGRSIDLVAREQRALRQNKVHAGCLHSVDAA